MQEEEAAAPAGELVEEQGLAEPLRRCLVTGAVRPKTEMLRFVLAPDGAIVPDLAGRLPGRGLWLTPRRDIVAAAVAKKLFGRAARAPVTVSADLADRVEHLLRQRCGELIGLARRSGQAVAGFEKVCAALREGKVVVLVAAADGGEAGREKVRAKAPELPLVDVLSAAEIGAAFGREHAVHAAIGHRRLGAALLVEAKKLAGFREETPTTGRRIATGRGTGTGQGTRRLQAVPDRRNGNDGTETR